MLTETCAAEAKTIHRLLEATPTKGYGKNADNKLNGDVMILDESSMTDILRLCIIF